MTKKKYTLPDTLTLENLSQVISNYPTKNKQGFISSEIQSLLKKYKINKKKFNEMMGINTCMVIDGEIVSYHTDIEMAIRCVLRGRGNSALEFD